MDNKKVYLSPADLAERWGIKASTISTNASRNRRLLPRFKKLGGRIRFDLQDVEAFEELQTVDVHSEQENPVLTGVMPVR
ncbi:helix-turn-helix domain-containing protein [Neptuniibacter sp.]|uniref:helix-turn-helix domain-containing protein n=1 Tax=Neptuniibacter sp. TaxID=1962643 RepID=UPI002603A7BC|nr:helix-turn-helix domain-containing protein [Neptuniibacter sp.]MCP4595413.1 helix-turn-helix domain-containing protein [Neptuniibacter sp.]